MNNTITMDKIWNYVFPVTGAGCLGIGNVWRQLTGNVMISASGSWYTWFAAFNWAQFITLAIVGGIIGFLVKWGMDEFKGYIKHKLDKK